MSPMIETFPAPLTDRLLHRIRSKGPITFEEFMRSALYDPSGGYYCRNDIERWGREGDYRTSPERSELFAATFARYFARLYEELGSPGQWTILEVGAGSGHFAHGVLRALSSHSPNVFASTRYVIDEVSVSAQSVCRERLKAFDDRIEFAPVGNVQLEPGVIFSNELLDAFPVHRVTRQGSELKEFFVDVDTNGNFVWLAQSPSTTRLQAHLDLSETELLEGQTAEISLELENWITMIAASLIEGFVVSVDYGATAAELYPSSPGDPRHAGTLRGFRRHAFVDELLVNPGGHDLTATVNWTAVEKLGQLHQLEVVDLKPLDKFLIEGGILNQLEIESRNANDDADKLRLSTAAREMILPDGMVAQFQVMTQRKSLD